jgi:biotin carboxyl carrier protein
MSSIVCPNCGNQQDAGDRCRRCNSLFAYYADRSDPESSWRPVDGVPATSRPGRTENSDVVRDPTGFDKARKFYGVARWVTLALILGVVVLILRKGTPPSVSTDPSAAARAEEKIRDSEVAQSMGEPHKLRLDSTELNSYLSSNLATSNNLEAQSSANSAPAQQSSPAASSPTPTPGSGSAPATEVAPTLEDVQSAVRDVKVDMVGDVVKAYVVFNFHGQDLSMELDGHIHAENGYLKFEPTSGAIGSMPLPASTLQSVADRIMDSPENREKMKLPAGVNNIRVVDGQVVVDYK